MNSFMLTQKGVQWAFDRVESMRDYAHREGVLKRLDGHVLVADGSQHYTAGELNIIDHRSYGIPTEWEHDFRGHAGSKADICWRTGRSSREAIHLSPWSLTFGDSPWEGGIIQDGIIVAYSGAAAEHDEAMAYAVMGWCRAWCFTQAVDMGLWTPTRTHIGHQ
jgi:hypothetical protein